MQRMQQPMGPWAGFVPNKGGQIVMLTVWDTRLAFISSHLAAHEGHAHQRNSNVEEVLRERWPFTITHLFIRLILPSIWGVKSTRPDLLYFYNRLIRKAALRAVMLWLPRFLHGRASALAECLITASGEKYGLDVPSLAHHCW